MKNRHILSSILSRMSLVVESIETCYGLDTFFEMKCSIKINELDRPPVICVKYPLHGVEVEISINMKGDKYVNKAKVIRAGGTTRIVDLPENFGIDYISLETFNKLIFNRLDKATWDAELIKLVEKINKYGFNFDLRYRKGIAEFYLFDEKDKCVFNTTVGQGEYFAGIFDEILAVFNNTTPRKVNENKSYVDVDDMGDKLNDLKLRIAKRVAANEYFDKSGKKKESKTWIDDLLDKELSSTDMRNIVLMLSGNTDTLFRLIDDSDCVSSTKKYQKFVYTKTIDLVGSRKEVIYRLLDKNALNVSYDKLRELFNEENIALSTGVWYKKHLFINHLYNILKNTSF